MSVQPAEATEPEAVELPHGDGAFASLMDALAPDAPAEEGGAEAAEDGTTAPAGAGDAAGAASAGEPSGGAATADTDQGQAAGGAGSGTGAGGAEGAAAGGAAGDAAASVSADLPSSWVADASSFTPKLGELSNAFEERTLQAYQQAAFEEIQTEHAKYFESISLHPRRLVGTKVPSLQGDGEETLRDTEDAREWQEAVKSILTEEIQSRASKELDENRDFLTTVHQSIEIFQSNTDLIPGTKQFDVELANRFATLAKPYELRVEGKLQGYSIPVQPLIEQTRKEVHAQRAATPAAPAAPAKAAKARKPADPPQAGISSKAGQSSDTEDFSTLFGTLGLPGLRI